MMRRIGKIFAAALLGCAMTSSAAAEGAFAFSYSTGRTGFFYSNRAAYCPAPVAVVPVAPVVVHQPVYAAPAYYPAYSHQYTRYSPAYYGGYRSAYYGAVPSYRWRASAYTTVRDEYRLDGYPTYYDNSRSNVTVHQSVADDRYDRHVYDQYGSRLAVEASDGPTYATDYTVRPAAVALEPAPEYYGGYDTGRGVAIEGYYRQTDPKRDVYTQVLEDDGLRVEHRAEFKGKRLRGSDTVVIDNRPSGDSLQPGTNYTRDGRLVSRAGMVARGEAPRAAASSVRSNRVGPAPAVRRSGTEGQGQSSLGADARYEERTDFSRLQGDGSDARVSESVTVMPRRESN